MLIATHLLATHLLATPVQMQPPLPGMQRVCGPTMRVLEGLAHRYDERIVALGDLSSGAQVLLLVNAVTGSWTLLELAGNHREACVLAAGERWRDAGPLPGVEQ